MGAIKLPVTAFRAELLIAGPKTYVIAFASQLEGVEAASMLNAHPALIAERDGLASVLAEIVEEFGGTIDMYHKYGPHWTQKDGNETFDVSVLLDRSDLIDKAKERLAALRTGGK